MEGPPNFRIHHLHPPTTHPPPTQIPLGTALRITIDLSFLLKLFLRRPASGPLSVETERENDFRYTKDFTHE
jgi:hypothetical protein